MHFVFHKNTSPKVKYLIFSVFNNSIEHHFRFLSTQQKAVSKKEISSATLLPKYSPKVVESHWYEWWESQNYFKSTKSENESFIILLPPPNVTGTLHLGHVLTGTIQDVILRWRRMKGESVLWVPGVDHAGIATQVAVEKYLSQVQKVSKHSLGREEFIKKVWEWKEDKEMSIVQQLKSMGASLDWNHFKFTMDPAHSHIVTNAFIQLYNDGLIFRKKSLINWSCALKSSISDIEVDWLEIKGRTKVNVPGYEKPVDFGTLYEFAYKVCDEDEEIVVSTTRPETMLGDTAIAVHPDNPVHSKFKNKQVWHPFRKEKIPIIIDDFVDPNTGTGAVKITPSHSPVDFEIGAKHNLQSIEVINEEGRLNKITDIEKFDGIKRFDARKAIIDELKSLGLFRGYKTHSTKIPICSRSGDVIEFLLKDQWFLNCQSMAKKAISAIETGELKLFPDKFVSVWCDWLKDIKDWNLSRQLWWGHQIPMYECKFKDTTIWLPGLDLEEVRTKASVKFETSADNISISRESDVLDTWFSSGLLPMSILSDTGSRKAPVISLMVTGHDILFFWIAKMVMLNQHLTGKLPFNKVFLHGLVCDSKGRKMSKSVGNVIHPEDIINGRSVAELRADIDKRLQMGLLTQNEHQRGVDSQKKMFPNGIPECGVDALRFTLCVSNVQNHFINFDIEICQANRHFCNKLWQAMNYFIKITNNYSTQCNEDGQLCFSHIKNHLSYLNSFDRWILSRLAAAVEIADKNIASYNFHFATLAIKHFALQEFCDLYLESSKTILKDSSLPAYNTTITVFYHCLETTLRLLSPFMPFLSEHLYHALPALKGLPRRESITVEEFPIFSHWETFVDSHLDSQFEQIANILSVLRRVKIVYNFKKTKPKVFLKCDDNLGSLIFSNIEPVISNLSGVENFTRVTDFSQPNIIEKCISDGCIVYVEHEYNKEELLKLFEPAIKKEESFQLDMEKLLKSTSGPEWETKSHTEKSVHQKRINDLRDELQKIEEFKRVIQNCNK